MPNFWPSNYTFQKCILRSSQDMAVEKTLSLYPLRAPKLQLFAEVLMTKIGTYQKRQLKIWRRNHKTGKRGVAAVYSRLIAPGEGPTKGIIITIAEFRPKKQGIWVPHQVPQILWGTCTGDKPPEGFWFSSPVEFTFRISRGLWKMNTPALKSTHQNHMHSRMQGGSSNLKGVRGQTYLLILQSPRR